jgi:hypothetical protein
VVSRVCGVFESRCFGTRIWLRAQDLEMLSLPESKEATCSNRALSFYGCMRSHPLSMEPDPTGPKFLATSTLSHM